MSNEHFILYHPESDTYMYAHNEDERDVLVADGELCDVTGQVHHQMLAQAQLGPFNPDARDSSFTEQTLIVGSEANTVIVDEIEQQLPPGDEHLACLRRLLHSHGVILDWNGNTQGYRLKHNGTVFHGPTLESVLEVAFDAHVLGGKHERG